MVMPEPPRTAIAAIITSFSSVPVGRSTATLVAVLTVAVSLFRNAICAIAGDAKAASEAMVQTRPSDRRMRDFMFVLVNAWWLPPRMLKQP
jgi:hypothetical protein